MARNSERLQSQMGLGPEDRQDENCVRQPGEELMRKDTSVAHGMFMDLAWLQKMAQGRGDQRGHSRAGTHNGEPLQVLKNRSATAIPIG